jgi:hypothetical protein
MTKDPEKATIAVIQTNILDIKDDVRDIKSKLESNYATREWVLAEFGQTRKIVNAILITFGLAIVTAFAGFVVNGGLK